MAVVLHLFEHTLEHRYIPTSPEEWSVGHTTCSLPGTALRVWIWTLSPAGHKLGSRQPLVSLLSLATADRGKLPCYCSWLPVGFSWPASMDGTFTSLGLPWELSPSPPWTPPAEGSHPLPPLLLPTDILTTLYSIWTLVTHIAYPEFPSFCLIPAFSISWDHLSF